MKKKNNILLVLLVIAVLVFMYGGEKKTGYAAPPRQESLSAWYRLDGNTLDSAPSGKNGASYSNYTEGIAGQSAQFFGAQKITLPASNNLLQYNNSWTMMMWFNANSITSNNDVALGYQDRLINLYRTSTGSSAAYMGVYNSSAIIYRWDDAVGTFREINSTVSLNQWYHAALTYDGTTFKAYLNGNLVGSKVSTFFGFGTANGVLATYGLSYYFNGKIDEALFYNVPLTSGEILNYYNAMKSMTPTGGAPFSQYSFEDGNGTDSIGNNYGQISGSPQIVQGVSGNALKFRGNGVNADGMRIYSASTTPSTFTTCLWYKIAGNTTDPGQRQFLFEALEYGNRSGYFIEYQSNKTTLYHAVYNGVTGVNAWTYNDGGQPNWNQWHHTCLSYDGTYYYSYFDGVHKARYAFGYVPSTTKSVFIGCEGFPCFQRFLNGTVDEVKLWNYALTSNDVYEDYISNLPEHQEPAEDSLVHYWPLDGDAVDKAGILNGVPTGIVWEQGIKGSAARFDIAKKIDFPPMEDLAQTGFSIAYWINFRENATPGRGTNWAKIWMQYTSNYSGDNIRRGMLVEHDTVRYNFIFANGQPVSSYMNYPTKFPNGTEIGKWYYLVQTYNRGVATLYINGVFNKTQPSPEMLWCNKPYCNYFTIGQNLEATVDEFKVYNRALSESEVFAKYDAIVNPPAQPSEEVGGGGGGGGGGATGGATSYSTAVKADILTQQKAETPTAEKTQNLKGWIIAIIAAIILVQARKKH